MRVVAAIALITTLGACAKPAPVPATIDLTAVEQTLHQRSDSLQAAETAMDVERSITFWAEDAIIQGGGSPQIQGREAITALYRQFFTTGMLKSLTGTSSSLTVAASGDLAYEVGVNRMVLTGKDGDLLDMGKFLLVWKKVDSTWYVAALSFTSDAPAPVPVAAAK
jgi:ketosteroid isomerase-like protein